MLSIHSANICEERLSAVNPEGRGRRALSDGGHADIECPDHRLARRDHDEGESHLASSVGAIMLILKVP